MCLCGEAQIATEKKIAHNFPSARREDLEQKKDKKSEVQSTTLGTVKLNKSDTLDFSIFNS